MPIGAAKKEQQRRRRKKKHVPKSETDEERQRRLRRLEEKRRLQQLEDKRREDEAERAARKASSGVEIGLNDSDMAVMRSPSWADQMEMYTDEITTVMLTETNAMTNIMDEIEQIAGNSGRDSGSKDEKNGQETTSNKETQTTTMAEQQIGYNQCTTLQDCIEERDKQIAALRGHLTDVERTKVNKTSNERIVELQDTVFMTQRELRLTRIEHYKQKWTLRTELENAAARITQLEETVTTLRAEATLRQGHEREQITEITEYTETEPEPELEPQPEPQPDLTPESTPSEHESRLMDELQQTAAVIANVASTSEKLLIYEGLSSVGQILTEVNKDATEQQRVRTVDMLLSGAAEGDLQAEVCLVNVRGVHQRIKEDDGRA